MRVVQKKRTRMGSAKVVLKKMFKPEFFSTKKLNHSKNLSVNDVLSESDATMFSSSTIFNIQVGKS